MKQLTEMVAIEPLGDSGLIIRWGNRIDERVHRAVTAAVERLERQPIEGVVETVPGYASVAVHYDPVRVWKSRTGDERLHRTVFETMRRRIGRLLADMGPSEAADPAETRTVRIPVCYGGEYGPDLPDVAAHNGLSEEEVVAIHSGTIYTVYMIGFAPGFPYLGGMSERIAAPRRAEPRTLLPAGSVGIAGNQTGVYPLPTPGGWQLIGRTPVRLFRPESATPSLLRAGDRVEFVPISGEQYRDWPAEAHDGG